ncbi:hypothetical protein FXN80_20020 [Dickeya fangzhongdai]|uniref:hypothetical protein n=1 Tax=Dickeya fangzhongdai TaxID=1778540 RepID=UPI00136B2AFE|nr:hypothetical protein [Dickeya fangzhongdai]UMB76327.1 hypothetical protein FXN80_20020 [Dickeya fangzhongdai]
MALIMDRFAHYGKCFFVPLVSFVYNIDNPLLHIPRLAIQRGNAARALFPPSAPFSG